jgi:hypothetical protein
VEDEDGSWYKEKEEKGSLISALHCARFLIGRLGISVAIMNPLVH